MKSNKGFTLIELLVVISIVSLLSSIIIASLTTAREKARIAGAKSFASRAFQALGSEAGIILNFDLTNSPYTTEDSGDNNPITLSPGFNSAPSSTDTPSGQGRSIELRGISDYVEIATANNSRLADSTDSGNAFTFATWFKPTGNLVSPTTAGYIFARRGSHGGILQTGGKFCGQVWWDVVNTAMTFCNPASYEIGKWYHIALSVNKANTKASLYVDGILVAESTINFTIRNYGTNTFIVGGTTNYLARGIVDDARFYTDSITQ